MAKPKNKVKNIETKVTISLIMAIAISFGGYFFYEIKSREAALNVDIEGLDEYELCQYAYEKFGIKGVKEIGCITKVNSLSHN